MPRIGFSGDSFHALEFGDRIELHVPEPHGRVAHYHSTVHRLESESSADITADAVPELNRFLACHLVHRIEPSMTWLKPVDRTSGTLTLSAGTLPYLVHHGTLFSDRCPTTTALERTTVPMDDADRMPPLGAVKPQQKFFDDIHSRGRHAEQRKSLPSFYQIASAVP